jgi:hypothetical protein
VNPLTIPRAAAARIATEARLAGSRPTETGGFLLAVPGGSVSVLALAGENGVRRGRDLLHVGGLALASLFEWAEAHELTVAAQWHSHRLHAFLSDTDLRYGLNVPGFRTAVVPNYSRASSDPADWGWWVYDAKQWVETAAPMLGDTPVTVITFEEGRVHEH